MHEGVVRAGGILQRKNLEDPFDLSESESESEFDAGLDNKPDKDRVKDIEKDKRGMVDQHGNLKTPDFWSVHDPQVLSLRFVSTRPLSLWFLLTFLASAMLIHEYYAGQPADGQLTEPRYRHDEQWRLKCEEVALKCRDVISMCQKRGFKLQNLSMVSMFCIMHNLTIIVKDPASNFACEFAETFQPIMEKYAVRWPFAREYIYQGQERRLTTLRTICGTLENIYGNGLTFA